jgi:Zn-dependent peptidase ImmA (M78 family)/transcriptional regulator with XRE-family HTH domain
MSKGINGFQTGRLNQVLAARRLSQVQLAAMVGVSPPTISKWRSGKQAPEAEALERLASVVNVSPEWFTRQLPIKGSIPLFRSNASAHVAARQMLEARVEWTQDIALSLNQFVDFPSLNLPLRNFVNPDEIDDSEIEHAASECRDLWRLGRGAIPDIALAMEGAGVILVREETGITQIEGLSVWSDALLRPIVLLSADKDNGFRSRFDLAHELGHLILHKHIQHVTDRERHKQLERQAHRFAGAFLLPAENFSNEIRTPITLDSLLLLKQRWGISVAAMVMRLEALGIINEDDKMGLFKRRSARWGVKSEPGDDTRVPEQPRLLRRTVELLVSSGVLPLDAIPRHIGLSASDIEMIAGLPVDYFQGSAKVIELATLRSDVTRTRVVEDKATINGVVIPFDQRNKSTAR